MQTIVEPKQHIDQLWGKQRVKEDKVFRLMKYVLRVDHEGKVLLHNVVTGQLVVLDQEEAEMLDRLPAAYSPVMEQLVTEHYLVPEDYDEHQQVVNLRNILWKIVDAHSSKDITYYTILPTTACNARCWYCFEKGFTPRTMTQETANDVVEFIIRNCGGKAVKIRWFGGEPTLAADRIDQISQGLLDCGIKYSSVVTSNGYLFDDAMVAKAKQLWNTTQVTISIDGMENTYNRVKSFSRTSDNPYKRMMNNVELLIDQGIDVAIRMNFDKENCDEFPHLVKEFQGRFHGNPHLMVYAHQINTDMPLKEWLEMETWLNEKNEELHEIAKTYGNYRDRRKLPSLLYKMCEAGSSRYATIKPDGELVCCPDSLSDDQVIGNVWQGVVNATLVAQWRQFADHERCRTCALFPECGRLANCVSKDKCSHKRVRIEGIKIKIIGTLDRVCGQC